MTTPELQSQAAPEASALTGLHCRACGVIASPFRIVCPSCMSEEVEQAAMPETGTVYAFSTVHAAPPQWRLPYTIGYVDLPNGARVFSHLQGEGLTVGAQVRVADGIVGTLPDGSPRRQTVFVPAGDAK